MTRVARGLLKERQACKARPTSMSAHLRQCWRPREGGAPLLPNALPAAMSSCRCTAVRHYRAVDAAAAGPHVASIAVRSKGVHYSARQRASACEQFAPRSPVQSHLILPHRSSLPITILRARFGLFRRVGRLHDACAPTRSSGTPPDHGSIVVIGAHRFAGSWRSSASTALSLPASACDARPCLPEKPERGTPEIRSANSRGFHRAGDASRARAATAQKILVLRDFGPTPGGDAACRQYRDLAMCCSSFVYDVTYAAHRPERTFRTDAPGHRIADRLFGEASFADDIISALEERALGRVRL